MSYLCKCGKECKTKHNLYVHKLFRHSALSKTNKRIIFITIIITVVVTLIFTIWENNINKIYDEVRGIKPDIYVSLHSVFVINNSDFLDLRDDETRINFVKGLEQTQKDNGLIPLPFNDNAIFTIIDKETEETSCIIGFTLVYPNEKRVVGYTIPTKEHIDISNLCKGCLTNLIYGANIGTKTTDYVNIKVIFEDEIYVKKHINGKNLEECGNHCIRLKKQLIENEETFLGSFVVKKYDNNIYDGEMIKQFTGHYSAWGLELDIPENHISRVLSIYIPNCVTVK